jgi:hypothetical protein
MSSSPYELQWHGPYKWYGDGEDVLFSRPEIKQPGIYLWTILFDGQYLTYYVGETGRAFEERFKEHTRDCLGGLYRVYDPDKFITGKKELSWEGMWKKGTRDRMGEFLIRFKELAPIIHKFMGLIDMFLAPIDVDQCTRQRIESAIANHLYHQEGLIGTFQDNDIRYHPKRSDEEPISVLMNYSKPILGFCNKLIA